MRGESSRAVPCLLFQCFVLLGVGDPLLFLSSKQANAASITNKFSCNTMMNGNGSKRPADTGSNALPQASAKRPKTSAEVPEDQQDASWSTVMTPELVGTVARFLDLGTPSRPDLTNLCLVVGKATSRVVRKMYLAGNEWYISHLCRLAHTNYEHKRQAGMESWLEYNPDWRNRSIGANSEKNVYSIALEPAVVKDLDYVRNQSNIVLGGSRIYCNAPGLEFGIGDALLSVGGIDVTGMESIELRKLITSDKVIHGGKIVLTYMPASIRLFSDPFEAITFDLVASLKHLIETGIVDVNQEYGDIEKKTFIWFSLMNDFGSHSIDCFRFLLSVDGIDANVEDPHDGERPIHYCAYSDEIGTDVLKHFLDSQLTKLDLNAQDHGGSTALHLLINPFAAQDHRKSMSKLKLLLEAGADPNLPDGDGETPEQYLLSLLNSDETKGKESEIDEAVGMLRRYALKRRQNEA